MESDRLRHRWECGQQIRRSGWDQRGASVEVGSAETSVERGRIEERTEDRGEDGGNEGREEHSRSRNQEG